MWKKAKSSRGGKAAGGLLAEHRVNLQPRHLRRGQRKRAAAIYQQELSGYRATAASSKYLKPFISVYFKQDLDLLCRTRKLLHTNQEDTTGQT